MNRLHTGQARAADGTWRPTFTLHTDTCRYAAKADPAALPAALALWGRGWFTKFLTEGRVKRCRVCNPEGTDA